MKRLVPFLALCAWGAACLAPTNAADEGNHPDIGDFARIINGREQRFPFNFGPTGATGWFYGREFVINGLDKGSPADGVLKINDRIRAVNGVRLPEQPAFTDDEHDPRRVLGDGITQAEATDGRLVVTVWRNQREQDLSITLPALGSYSKTWPYDCAKSQAILKNACDYLAAQQLPDGEFVTHRGDGDGLAGALNGMLWLGSGDPKHLESARRLAYHFAAHPGADPFKGEDGSMWNWSYQAMFIAEYYLLTGDTSVLPYLEWLHKVIMAADHQRGSWCHGFINSNYAVGGYINQTGVMCLNALSLMQRAGFELDLKDLEHCKLYFRRYSYGGRGIHYGDHLSPYAEKPGGSGTGKNCVAILAFENFRETDTVDRFVTTVIDSYRHRDHCHTGPLWTMGGQAMVYALPLKLTRLAGVCRARLFADAAAQGAGEQVGQAIHPAAAHVRGRRPRVQRPPHQGPGARRGRHLPKRRPHRPHRQAAGQGQDIHRFRREFGRAARAEKRHQCARGQSRAGRRPSRRRHHGREAAVMIWNQAGR